MARRGEEKSTVGSVGRAGQRRGESQEGRRRQEERLGSGFGHKTGSWKQDRLWGQPGMVGVLGPLWLGQPAHACTCPLETEDAAYSSV